MSDRMALDTRFSSKAAERDQLRDTMDRMELEDEDLGELTSPGSTIDSEDGSGAKRKRERHPITAEQSATLNALLDKTAFPTTDERELLATQLDMTPRRVQIWFQNQRQQLKRSKDGAGSFPLRPGPNIPLGPDGNPPPNFIPYHNKPSSFRTSPTTSPAVPSPNGAYPAATATTSGRSSTSPQSHPSDPIRREYGQLSDTPTLPPIQHQPPISLNSWNESSPDGRCSGDAASIRTFASGSSSSSHGGSSQGQRNKTLPPLASVLGSLPQMDGGRDSSSSSIAPGEAGPDSGSATASVYSNESRRGSIAPTIADSISPTQSSARSARGSISTSHSTASHISATPQSIFVHPGHKTRPISDLLPKPKLSRLFGGGGSSSSSSSSRRGGSNSILDAAITTSQTWSRPIKHPSGGEVSRSNDVLDAAIARRNTYARSSASSFVSARTSHSAAPVFPMGPRRTEPQDAAARAGLGLDGMEGKMEE